MSARSHIPVLLAEVLEAISPQDSDVIVDGTFGWGGYSEAFLKEADCAVIGIDRDPAAISRGEELSGAYEGRLRIVLGRFGEMDIHLADLGIEQADGIALDLGVSSLQLDQAERGFSFQKDGPLDMRMGGSAQDSPSAADIVNTVDEGELADILFKYGEERRSRRVARAVVEERKIKPLTRTSQLADVVTGVLGRPKPGQVHPATRTFQALRIFVNDELGELERGLRAAERLLRPEGRLAVVSFHSLEDRIVKNFLRERAGEAPRGSRHLPDPGEGRAPSFRLQFRGARKPADAEAKSNPRARSARLRAAWRTESPAWPDGVRGAA
ncbi:MAG: 16S rRNA (cytosine(1402)-N(4))-methyltransferase RsmH [Alphaproteobacteria bacterium]|nr:16S rRNA (cytosine(1402)-N(4))-methyltransferase RsmH [Alphaproteobacteria bacterium]